MSDLYKLRDGEGGGDRASRRDVLLWLGWEECPGEECSEGWVFVEDFVPFQGGYMPNHGAEPHDACVDGLVPPARQVEAAADGMETEMSDLWVIAEWVDDMTVGSKRKAFRRDVLLWLGWRECERCEHDWCRPQENRHGSECQPCGTCADGLVPSARQVEVVMKALPILREATILREAQKQGQVARAALVEWAKTLEDT